MLTYRFTEQVRAFLRAGEGSWAESVCPTGEADNYVWTRKRIVPVTGSTVMGPSA